MTSHEREDFGDIRIDDLRTLLVVERTASLAAAARHLDVSSSRVSKVIARLEKRLGLPLVSRSSRGVGLTEAGQRLLPEIAGLIEKFGKLARHDVEPTIEITIAGEPYLVAMCQPVIAAAYPRLRVRGLQMTGPSLRASVAENVFDLGLITSGLNPLPTMWALERIGRMRKGLFTTPSTAERLGAAPIDAESLRGEPFVSPTTPDQGLAALLDDDCPLRASERVVGHQTEAMSVGLDVAAGTGQLIFGPVALARPHVESGRLVEVRVEGWDVCPDLFMVCHGERILMPVRNAILRELRRAIDETHQP
jgi:DNA-binding transcriptional LysR family regulator